MCTEGSFLRPCPTPSVAIILPSLATIKSVNAESISFHNIGETISISSDDSTLSVQHPPVVIANVPSREELDVLLKRFPTLIDMESPASNMSELLSVTQWILVDVAKDP